MAHDEEANVRPISTTSAWRWAKIRRPPEAEESSPSEASPTRSLLAWPRKRPMSLRVRYRGGPECWWEVTARGRTIRRPGSVCLHDVLAELYAWPGGIPPQGQ